MRQRQGAQGFSFFSFTPFGLPILVLGILYMLFARRLLAAKPVNTGAADRPTLRAWTERYRLAEREQRVVVTAGSVFVGKRIEDYSGRIASVSLLAIERGSGLSMKVLRPTPQTRIEAGDVLLVDANPPMTDIQALCESYSLEPRPFGEGGEYFSDRSQEIGMVEVILPAESLLIGKTVEEARVRSKFGLTVIGLRHGGKVVTEGLQTERLKLGDTLLLVGFWSDIRALQSDSSDIVVLNMPAEFEEVLPAASRAPYALAILGLVVALMVAGVVPNVQAALIGCLLMRLFGCVDFNSAYGSISWKTLVLIVGMLPFRSRFSAPAASISPRMRLSI